MRAEIIAIGDELTTGQRLDTNSQWLAEQLCEIGVSVAFHTTVGDTLADNVLVFRQACERADVIVASGGLGPTADDLTRQALADMLGVPLVQDDGALAHIRSLFARRKREMPPANLIQAQFPQGSRPIPNPHGTAPGIDLPVRRPGRAAARVFALPGVPAEMKEMWEATVAPAIQQQLGVRRVIAHYRIRCFGVGESDLEAMLPDLIARQRYPLVGITVSKATITLRITAEGESREAARAAMQPTIETIRSCLGDLIFGEEEDELQDAVVRLLRERRKTLAITELGTGGLLAYLINECPGAQEVFAGGELVSDPRVTAPLLDHSPGSAEQAARQIAALARELRRARQADYALAVGPFPQADSPTTQPGQFHFAIAFDGGEIAKSSPFAGHPEILRPLAAKRALNLLRLHLLGRA